MLKFVKAIKLYSYQYVLVVTFLFTRKNKHLYLFKTLININVYF